jgi:phosphoenolpyruvate carboxylase
MEKPDIITGFEKSVKNKFDIYNSLFLNLPFDKISKTGMFVPLLQHMAEKGLADGREPLEILDDFFTHQVQIDDEAERVDFMFRVIQYIERQVVLYDSVEDAAFVHMQQFGEDLSLRDFIVLAARDLERDEIVRHMNAFSARIVFTAHPTQFYTPAVLDIISRLRRLIDRDDINGIDSTLQQLGMTSLINSARPTPLEEAKNVIYFLREVYYSAVGELYGKVRRSFPGEPFDNPDLIQLGFWPGGDRDGNPFVTAGITRQVADELRMTLMKCYYQDVKQLQRKLTFRGIAEIILDIRNQLYPAMFDPEIIIGSDALLQPLRSARALLVQKYNRLYLDELDNLIDKVRIFRTHFAALDIRQNHSVQHRAVTEILRYTGRITNSLDELSREELIRILLRENIQPDPGNLTDDLVQDTIRTIATVREIQQRNGEAGCNRYVISDSEDIFSVLYVFALFRWYGGFTGSLPVDIVPLFETMNGMDNSEVIMRELFDLPEYRAHLRHRDNRQTMMLGFSDGTKDGGYLKANWSIFRTKERLSTVCSDYDVQALFFDGRGGPPARGGGKTHRFYAAQGQTIASHAIQLTIQGQTITSKYGTKEHFIHNFEQLVTAGLSNRLPDPLRELDTPTRELINEMAQISFEKYTALKQHALFVPYLELKSTLRYYNRANIGSRPAKRGNQVGLVFKDLRAIPFVGSWSQLKQNVPGYFGIGTALKALCDRGQKTELQKMFRQLPFFRAIILNSMMSLSKSNFNLTSYISRDDRFGGFWRILHDEYLLSRQMVLEIAQYDQLMQEEPVSSSSIAIREKIVLPLLIIQQYALQKIEQQTPNREVYEKIVTRSLYGNINASRNSA